MFKVALRPQRTAKMGGWGEVEHYCLLALCCAEAGRSKGQECGLDRLLKSTAIQGKPLNRFALFSSPGKGKQLPCPPVPKVYSESLERSLCAMVSPFPATMSCSCLPAIHAGHTTRHPSVPPHPLQSTCVYLQSWAVSSPSEPSCHPDHAVGDTKVERSSWLWSSSRQAGPPGQLRGLSSHPCLMLSGLCRAPAGEGEPQAWQGQIGSGGR